MSNTTDPLAQTVHGTNPQYLVEKITRTKIYQTTYWKEQCFGLTSESIVDKAIGLKYVGGNYGGNVKPCNFLCLILKLLQLQPEQEIVLEYVKQDEFKYLRALGAFYLRLVSKAELIYQFLEPLLNDYRKLSYRGTSGWRLLHMDEFVDSLLTDELVCDIALPHLVKRIKLEELNNIPPRRSALDIEFVEDHDKDAHPSIDLHIDSADIPVQQQEHSQQFSITDSVHNHANTTIQIISTYSKQSEDDLRMTDQNIDKNLTRIDVDTNKQGSRDSSDRDDRRRRQIDSRYRDDRRRRRSDSSDRDDRRRRRSNSSDRDDRRRRRSDSRDRDDRRRRQIDSRYRDDRRRRRSDSSDGDDRRRRRSNSSDGDDRRRRQIDSRDRNDESVRESRLALQTAAQVEESKDREDPSHHDSRAVLEKNRLAEKRFDKMFGKSKNGVAATATSRPQTSAAAASKIVSSSAAAGKAGKEVIDSRGEKVVITAPEGTVEYWNQMREALGMKKLK